MKKLPLQNSTNLYADESIKSCLAGLSSLHSANTTKQMKRNQNTGASRSLANVADYTFFFFLKWIQNFEGMTEQHNIPKWHSYLNNAVVAGK